MESSPRPADKVATPDKEIPPTPLQIAKKDSSTPNPTPVTRKTSTIFGLGSGITAEDSQITGSRLPTCKQVLRCLMFYQQEEEFVHRTKLACAQLVLAKVAPFYGKANIPMISGKKACEKMIKLLASNAKIRAIPVSRRKTTATVAKLEQMETELSKTFALWPPNAEELIQNPEDLAFLNSMKTDRIATFGSFDKVLDVQRQRVDARALSETKRREKAEQEMADCEASTSYHHRQLCFSSSSEDNTSETDCASPAPLSNTPPRRHRRKRTGTSVVIPHNILQSPKLVSLATRMKITPAQQAAFTEALISESGGDTSQVTTSYSSADRARRNVGDKIAKSCKDQWHPPKLASLHWDSKLLQSLSNQNVTEERLTIAMGTTDQIKLLGVPSYKPGTDRKSGDIIAGLTMDLLESWHCTSSIVNMVFDTTASNTGHLTAACIKIQDGLQQALLWAGCRHHVGEVILAQVFNDLQIETSRSPEVTLFARFRKNFELLPHSDQPLVHMDVNNYDEEAKTLLDKWRNDVLQTMNTEKDLKRDDYREFIELCIMFLGSAQTTTPNFKQPGAIHKARWMAKLLYSIKICLLEAQISQLPAGTITTAHQVPKVREFVIFITLIYSSWWITCPCATDAPWNDLNLYRRLLMYEAVNPAISSSAIKAMKRHLWYLTAEMVPLALFSNRVPSNERRELADRLIAVKPASAMLAPKNRFGTGFGKPKFPTDITSTTTLADFVNEDSWFTLHILQINTNFLTEDVHDWSNSPAYQDSSDNVRAINVINDCAERGVKLSSDFLDAARSEEHYQNVLQVVEQDRRNMPNLRKRKSNDDN